jgi:hypothetical protein
MSTVVVSGIVSLLVSLVTASSTFLLQRNKARGDLDAQRERLEGDMRKELAVQRERLEFEMRLEIKAEEAIRELLSIDRWKRRTFDMIRQRVGGVDDDELRRLLVRSGALRFQGPSGVEQWGLRERNGEALNG